NGASIRTVLQAAFFPVLPVFVWAGRFLQLHRRRQKTPGFEQIHINKNRGTRWSAEAFFSLEY
ncbi:MAG: hypothetical protein ACKPHU_01105, partial [Planctomycetaceae bacterium]